MNILMVTNKYLPASGGLVRSVHTSALAYRQGGHRVLIIAPELPGNGRDQEDVIRLPAFQAFSDREFSVHLPVPGLLHKALEDFQPQVVHSHHPFLLGNTALRIAAARDLPLVFTHHTLYEKYADYLFAGRPRIKAFIVRLVCEYANLCQHVLAPSQSIADLLAGRGVAAPVSVVPTGIDCDAFARGNRQAGRARLAIAPDAAVLGYVGRLSAEKNLDFLTRSACACLARDERRLFLVVGGGPTGRQIREILRSRNLLHRLRMPGPLEGQELIDAYHAMDIFAFASQSETQGLVLAEAMAAGLIPVALDGPGVREIVRHRRNGLLLEGGATPDDLAAALDEALTLPDPTRQELAAQAVASARDFSIARCAARCLDLYARLASHQVRHPPVAQTRWANLLRRMELERHIWSRRLEAVHDALKAGGGP